MALAEGAGALLTVYWVKFNPYECYFSTCENPPFWLGMAMLAAFGAGVVVPVSGLILGFTKLLHSSSSKMTSPDSSIANSSRTHLIQQEQGRFRLSFIEFLAFCLLVATGLALYIVHWLYMQFYFACYVGGPIFPLGVGCNNVFANALFTEWTIASMVFIAGAAVVGSLAGFRKSSRLRRKEAQLSPGNLNHGISLSDELIKS